MQMRQNPFLHMICDEQQINNGYISHDFSSHRKPPLSPTSVHAINNQTDTYETDTTYFVHDPDIHTIFDIPLPHRSTQKENWLTTRLLYPKTHLLSSLPNTMPVFKNRLHRLYAYRRLFKDVNIETVSFEETKLFHQRAFSLATIPNTPGYHLNLLMIQDMQRDLHKIWNGVQHSLKEEKTISHEGKIKRHTEFNNHVEAARSLLPAEMRLDENFPIGSMIGLTRDEASSLLFSYHESKDKVKNTTYYKKNAMPLCLFMTYL